MDPAEFTIKTIFKRLDKFGDLFEKALTDRQDISGFLETLAAKRHKGHRRMNHKRHNEDHKKAQEK